MRATESGATDWVATLVVPMVTVTLAVAADVFEDPDKDEHQGDVGKD